ncbi:FecR family protein [Cupriavidus sp. 30B13]|uniref:FecR family protein n=1 Tax=Cupriavidus sp. 30B13 TaxID=3384241 RepID=UPI003B8ED2DB
MTAELREEAARWFLRMHGAEPDDGQRSRFEAWLASDPAHAQAFRAIAGVWDDFDSQSRLQALAAASQATAARGEPARRGPRRRAFLKQGALAVALSAGAGALAWRLGLQGEGETRLIATGPGQTRDVTLDDGSRIEVGPATRLRVAYGAARRAVSLLEGAAAFDVRRDPDRPFVVDSGALEVAVLGTYFAVDMLPARTRVSVARGQVRVARPRRILGWRFGDEERWLLGAGEVLDVGPDGATRPGIPAADAFSWQSRVLTFSGTPLTEVAQTLSRYRAQPFIAEPALARIRIAAVVRTGDIERFIASLPGIAPVRVVPGGADTPTYLEKL